MGAGKCTLLMAEELGLEDLAGNRTAVDGHERALYTGGILMQRVGDQLLSGPGLADDEHRRAGRRHHPQAVEQLLHAL